MSATDPTDRLGATVGGRYALRRLLGVGGMGAVYEAEHGVTGHRVAVKILRPELRCSPASVERLLREARLANAIDHPGVVESYDAGVDADGTAYIAFKLLHGESVEALLERETRLPVDRAARLASDVLDILDAAHRRGVVHRDVKPSNVFLVEGEDVDGPACRLLDFGVARVIEDRLGEPGQGALTETGMVIGTGHYASPEQVRGDKGVDGRADLWAVGVMLHRLVAGAQPFRGANLQMLFVAILSEPPVALEVAAPWAPPGLCAVVRRALEKDPSARHASASEMRDALRQVLDGEAGEPPRPPADAPRARGWARAVAGLAVSAVFLAGASAFYVASRRPGTPTARPAASVSPVLPTREREGVVSGDAAVAVEVTATPPLRVSASPLQRVAPRTRPATRGGQRPTAPVEIRAATPPPPAAAPPDWHGPGPTPVRDIRGI